MPAPEPHTRRASKHLTVTAQGKEPSFTDLSTPTSPPLPCAICTRLSTTFPCCVARTSPSPCPTCLAFNAAVATQVPDAKTTRQIQQDRVESLKLETKDLEAEKYLLEAAVQEKRKILQQKIKQLEGMVPRNEYRKRMKKVRKAGEAKKLPGEK